MGQRTKNTENIIAVNKKATYDYFILEKIEAGIVLEGWEVKGIRDLKVQLKEAYVKIYKGNVIVCGRKSTNSLYDTSLVSFDEEGQFNQKDAEGFIKVNSLRLRNKQK